MRAISFVLVKNRVYKIKELGVDKSRKMNVLPVTVVHITSLSVRRAGVVGNDKRGRDTPATRRSSKGRKEEEIGRASNSVMMLIHIHD